MPPGDSRKPPASALNRRGADNCRHDALNEYTHHVGSAVLGRWRATGADVRLPQDTEWGQHEGVLIDPDGNVIRFGSPMP
jgi:uncharacterized glyoxalase superfamily protein PhnB